MRMKVAYWGVFTSLAILFGYVESLIPLPIGIPGLKLGIANVVAVVLLYKFSIREAAGVSIARVMVSGFLFSSGMMILYSLSGAILSLIGMMLLKRTGKFSIYGVSMLGGVAHNMGQIALAAFVTESYSILYYLPVLMMVGCVTGLFVGFVSDEILRRMPFEKVAE